MSEPARMLSGSSPRMRGTLDLSGASGNLAWIIPAHAGNSAVESVDSWTHVGSSPRMRGTPEIFKSAMLQTRSHPRACGELLEIEVPAVHSVGSSPRMRGTLREQAGHADHSRIIPAHAGNSIQPAS